MRPLYSEHPDVRDAAIRVLKGRPVVVEYNTLRRRDFRSSRIAGHLIGLARPVGGTF